MKLYQAIGAAVVVGLFLVVAVAQDRSTGSIRGIRYLNNNSHSEVWHFDGVLDALSSPLKKEIVEMFFGADVKGKDGKGKYTDQQRTDQQRKDIHGPAALDWLGIFGSPTTGAVVVRVSGDKWLALDPDTVIDDKKSEAQHRELSVENLRKVLGNELADRVVTEGKPFLNAYGVALRGVDGRLLGGQQLFAVDRAGAPRGTLMVTRDGVESMMIDEMVLVHIGDRWLNMTRLTPEEATGLKGFAKDIYLAIKTLRENKTYPLQRIDSLSLFHNPADLIRFTLEGRDAAGDKISFNFDFSEKENKVLRSRFVVKDRVGIVIAVLTQGEKVLVDFDRNRVDSPLRVLGEMTPSMKNELMSLLGSRDAAVLNEGEVFLLYSSKKELFIGLFYNGAAGIETAGFDRRTGLDVSGISDAKKRTTVEAAFKKFIEKNGGAGAKLSNETILLGLAGMNALLNSSAAFVFKGTDGGFYAIMNNGDGGIETAGFDRRTGLDVSGISDAKKRTTFKAAFNKFIQGTVAAGAQPSDEQILLGLSLALLLH